MNDTTETARRTLQQEVNAARSPRQVLEDTNGEAWDTQEFGAAFTVTGFMAPFVVVVRKSDGVKGTLMFQHSPRLYWAFSPA